MRVCKSELIKVVDVGDSEVEGGDEHDSGRG